MSNKSEKPVEFSIRSSHEGDSIFVFNSWVYSLRKHHAYYRHHVPNSVFESDTKLEIHNYLKHGARVAIAHKAENSNDPIGFICYSDLRGIIIVHYVFVKQKYREMGIGKALVYYVNVDPTSEEVLTTTITIPVTKLQKENPGKYKFSLVDSLYKKLLDVQNKPL